jgi:hypothetical protein
LSFWELFLVPVRAERWGKAKVYVFLVLYIKISFLKMFLVGFTYYL